MVTISRREALKISGAALGSVALGAGPRLGHAAPRAAEPKGGGLECKGACYPPANESDRQTYSYFYEHLDVLPYYHRPDPSSEFLASCYPPLDDDELRITFMGSCIPPVRRAQNMMSIFVEVGWDAARRRARDAFVFDCGSGVAGNYGAMEVGYARMDKVFITHLHGDHMSDLTHVYCFGPSADRLTPLYVFGPSASGVPSPRPPRRFYDDGTVAFCRNLRDAMRWHTESFGFQNTAYTEYPSPAEVQRNWQLPQLPRQVADDPWGDGYALVPVELDWRTEGGVAYWNRDTEVKVTHFPVIHCRQGSIGYKLEWRGLSMIYSSDTKPEKVCVRQASGGAPVDVFIHEMVVPPEIWAMQVAHMPAPDYTKPGFAETVRRMQYVQGSSHTPQGAFGFLLSQIDPRPRLAVATHFPVSDDTVACAMRSVAQYVPDIGALGENLTFSFDRMVISVNARTGRIRQRRAATLDYGSSPLVQIDPGKTLAPPKYADANGNPDPYVQLDRREEYQPADGYCDSGY